MRELTLNEIKSVVGGNAFGGGGAWWESLTGTRTFETIIVTGRRPAGADVYDDSEDARMAGRLNGLMNGWNSLPPSTRAAILGGAVVSIGTGLVLAASVTPAGALVFGVMAVSTAQTAGSSMIVAGGLVATMGHLFD